MSDTESYVSVNSLRSVGNIKPFLLINQILKNMCLKIKKIRHLNHSAKIARKPIKCYKVLLYNSNELITPVAFSCVPASSRVLVADNMKKHTYDPIIENGIHTFSTLKSAYKFCDSISVHYYKTGIFPAYIPKGTYYWIGKNHEYVSERIEFL